MFEYPCPDCYSSLSVHEEECQYAGTERATVEKAYIDIISILSVANVRENSLETAIDDWSPLHRDCLDALAATHRVAQKNDGRYKLLDSDERKQTIAPTTDPLRTIYEYGTVKGCHDNGIFALVAYYANQDLSWEATKQKMREWFDRTGTWERGGFKNHDSIEEVLVDKEHVWAEAYGWTTKGRAAARVIENHQKGVRGEMSANQPASPSEYDAGSGGDSRSTA